MQRSKPSGSSAVILQELPTAGKPHRQELSRVASTATFLFAGRSFLSLESTSSKRHCVRHNASWSANANASTHSGPLFSTASSLNYALISVQLHRDAAVEVKSLEKQ